MISVTEVDVYSGDGRVVSYVHIHIASGVEPLF